jgi:hypothetical protein
MQHFKMKSAEQFKKEEEILMENVAALNLT